jgi:hypothetical protein
VGSASRSDFGGISVQAAVHLIDGIRLGEALNTATIAIEPIKLLST